MFGLLVLLHCINGGTVGPLEVNAFIGQKILECPGCFIVKALQFGFEAHGTQSCMACLVCVENGLSLAVLEGDG